MNKKRIYLGMLLFALLLTIVLVGICWYLSVLPFVWQRGVFVFFCWLFSGVALLATAGIGFIFFSLFCKRSLGFMERYIRFTIALFFPLILRLGGLFALSKEKIEESFIAVNNQMVRSLVFHLRPAEILLLAPHCLQKDSCPHKITVDSKNCKQCGLCCVGELMTLCKNEGIAFLVVTGGTVARKRIRDLKPRGVVAVACHRDLVSGIQECYPLPVLGILNQRPEGPCHNTCVHVAEVAAGIRFFLGDKE